MLRAGDLLLRYRRLLPRSYTLLLCSQLLHNLHDYKMLFAWLQNAVLCAGNRLLRQTLQGEMSCCAQVLLLTN